jgi:membrane-bound serine protease (ClpP class)
MPGRRFWLALAAVAIAFGVRSPGASAADTSVPLVLTASLDAEINSATSDYLAQAVSHAQARHAAALVVVMNTPGGLSSSMDEMITSLLSSKVPTVVYVGPPGARADSAGLFVAQAADIVAMAPGTNIGSAHPIDAGGGNIGGELEQKVVNDAVARIRDLAASHGRNADWCEQAVRQSVNIGADRALGLHVADLQAPDLPALLAALDGRRLPRPHAAPTTLHLARAAVQDDPMPLPLRLLQLILDPNVAYLLLLLAIFGIVGELTTPGAILPGVVGVVGVISAVLALVAFTSLPVNLAGVLLVLFSFVLFVVDLKAPTHGVLTIGGIASLVLGSVFLFDTGQLGGVGLNPWLIAGAALAIAGLFGLVLGKAVRARHRPAYDVTVPAARPAEREEEVP